MPKTLIILNPHAANGRAGDLWSTLEPMLQDTLGDIDVAITQSPAQVIQHIQRAYDSDITRVISVGGDGTNHSVVNALAKYQDTHPDTQKMEYGILPIGTGRDWARSLGIPFDIEGVAKWITAAQPTAVDIGHVQLDDRSVYFLNIASVGISGDVVKRVENAKRRPWSFLSATLQTMLSYDLPTVKLRLDGQDWYDGAIYLVAIANGTTFGRGMQVAPHAKIDDGFFDIVLVEGMSHLRAINTIRRVYSGNHLQAEPVHHQLAQVVEIVSPLPIGMELDGEYAEGKHLRFEIKKEMLNLLV